jgi:hypothetical protein
VPFKEEQTIIEALWFREALAAWVMQSAKSPLPQQTFSEWLALIGCPSPRIDVVGRLSDNLLTTSTPDWEGIGERLDHAVAQVLRMRSVYSFVLRRWGLRGKISDRDLLYWLGLGLIGKLEKTLKFHFASFLAHAWGHGEYPPVPQYIANLSCPFIPFSGKLGNLLRMKTIRFRTSSLRLAFSLNQAKGGALAMEPEQVQESVNGALLRLTTDRTDVSDSLSERRQEIEDFLVREVRRTVREVFGNWNRIESDPARVCIGTNSGCYRNPRHKGGAHQALCDIYGEPTTWVDGLVMYIGDVDPVEVRGCVNEQTWFEVLSYHRQRAWGICSDYSGVPAEPVGLVEPFKVRVITKGDPSSYILARQWQLVIWKKLVQHPTFQLVGHECDEMAMRYFCRRMDDGEDLLLVSGDFEAATDNLDPLLTEAALQELAPLVGMSPEDQIVMLRCLTGHQLKVDESPEGDIFEKQVWGQLMGSPISFPFLCLINAALARFSLEMCRGFGHARVDLDELPLLINGDDILFQGSSLEFSTWKHVTRMGGLLPSLGKNHTHESFCTINSQLWELRRQTAFGGVFWEPRRHVIPHMGICYGSCKTAVGRSVEDPFDNLGARARDFVASCPGKEYEALSQYIRANKDDLYKVPKGVAWFLPESLLGVGLPLCGASPSKKISEMQRRVASMVYEEPWRLSGFRLSLLSDRAVGGVDLQTKQCLVQLLHAGKLEQHWSSTRSETESSMGPVTGLLAREQWSAGSEPLGWEADIDQWMYNFKALWRKAWARSKWRVLSDDDIVSSNVFPTFRLRLGCRRGHQDCLALDAPKTIGHDLYVRRTLFEALPGVV